HLAAVPLDQLPAASLYAPGFVAKESQAADALLQFTRLRIGVISGGPIFFEQVSGDEVDLLVGALRRENGGDEQFERVGIIQLAMSIRISVLQAGNDFLRAGGSGGEGFARHRRLYRPDFCFNEPNR